MANKWVQLFKSDFKKLEGCKIIWEPHATRPKYFYQSPEGGFVRIDKVDNDKFVEFETIQGDSIKNITTEGDIALYDKRIVFYKII